MLAVVLRAVCGSTAVVVPIIFWPLSQTLWMAFDLRPARAGELAPAYLDAIGVDPRPSGALCAWRRGTGGSGRWERWVVWESGTWPSF